MTNELRLHASAEDLNKDYLTLYRVSTPVSLLGPQEIPYEELNYNLLNELLEKLESGFIRKPVHFNNLHFLLLLLYDSHGYQRDRYPLWRWYYRIKKKFLTAKHLTIDTDNSRQYILTALEQFIDTNVTISILIEEGVQLEEQYLHSPIHGLFKFYTPLHTYLYMEQIDKPILNENLKIFHLFQSSFMKLYQNLCCDLIHFSIAHKKTNLLNKIFGENINWLDLSMNLTTERGWLPLHYASYVGDKDTVKTICDALTSPTLSIHFNTLSLLIPNFKQELFDRNPNEYILKTFGVEHTTHTTKQNKNSRLQSSSIDIHKNLLAEQYFQNKLRSNIDPKDQPSLSGNIHNNNNNNNNNSINNTNDNDIPDADELELSSLPLIQRDEFIDKVLHMYDTKQMLISSPLILACLATCGNRIDYEDIVKILLESHLFEYDGLNHECILNHVVNYMHRNDYAHFQSVQVYRDTETEGPSAYIFYQFDGFIVNQDVKPISSRVSGSLATLNTSKNDESAESDDDHQHVTTISVRCLLTVLVLRDIFIQYPRWDFHLLRENIEEHFSDLENALGCRPTILYPDGDIISSRKRSDVTWEVIVRYRLSSETGESLYMQVDYYFFDSFGDPLADALVNAYQTPFYISCMTDSTIMMNTIFDSFFKRRHLHRWGTIAEKHLENCFDGILQIKNNCTTFLSLCTTLSHYYQLDGDPFIEENSATIQRIFVHAFACCVRRNSKIELDYLIKNHALIYYDSCRTKPSDIRHNILTYCVVRNLAVAFDQLMTNMKTSMYKTYQNSTNPDWQPHIAWKEIIHVIIDPVLQQQNGSNEQNDLTQLACYGDTNTNSTSIGSVPVLHASGEEYIRCINSRKNIILKAKRKLPRASNDFKKVQPIRSRVSSSDRQQLKDVISHTDGLSTNHKNGIYSIGTNSYSSDIGDNGGVNENLTKKSRNIFKNVNRLRWGGKHERHSTAGITTQQQQRNKKRISSTIGACELDESSRPTDAISLPDVNDDESSDDDRDAETSDVVCPTTPILTHRAKLQRSQTIGTVQRRQYPSRRKALQHLRALFRPNRQKVKTSIDNDHEQMPMINVKRTTQLRRTSSDRDNHIRKKDEKTNERRKHYRLQRRSDTVAFA
ncbi:unnamed protein product [Rotaria sp. Silwood2]|nr:unnamed protein product [Rotaria sp. Silwood2]CAF2718902.1 unnamed protein product [Rotaria sp. Silwood2]CAF4287198.1 unnamed protein product [Rotaria sp. Silwood2]CAF4375092.1 unnamed protein product [Rotaria sp. Silwood2]CAF4531906.1 unnamed protein product [Rotaria sp. Silwood2]